MKKNLKLKTNDKLKAKDFLFTTYFIRS